MPVTGPPRTLWPRVIPAETTPAHQKLLLGLEIIGTYLVSRRSMAHTDIREVVATMNARSARLTSPWEPGSLEERLVAGRLGNAVTRTLAALPSDSRCLVRSLVLMSLLAARGIPAKLVIGAHSRPHFAAHAWVEHAGRPVLSAGPFEDSRLLEL